MSQPKHVHALKIPQPKRSAMSERTQKYFDKCEEKLGMVPNVIAAYAFDEDKLNGFSAMYNELMLGPSGLSKLEREMIAVTVSSINHCYYCLTAHGAAVRELSGDPVLGELMVMNYRAADLPKKQRAMLDFAAKLTETPDKMEEEDRKALRKAGWTDRDIWDIAATASFFNMSNRMAAAIDMMPNLEYHGQARGDRARKDGAPAAAIAEALRSGARKSHLQASSAKPKGAKKAKSAKGAAAKHVAQAESEESEAATKARLARGRRAGAAKPHRASAAEAAGAKAAAGMSAADRAAAARARKGGRRKATA
ncbi:peroxidase-related enzyme [Marinibaculum pumilum]|uniref:Peroxidase-related enzyme n=1 Tax=Marinibaculum pumilum TaxID=1766165 RepID=A0ABV7LAB3_9PROT